MTSWSGLREGRDLPLKADLEKAARLDGRTLRDCAQAVAELAIARIRLIVDRPDELLALGLPAEIPASPPAAARAELIDRVAFAIPRMGARVPWRATCLVQALAAQRWLRREGVEASLRVGVRATGEAAIDAHAWLETADRVVIGGDISGYRPFSPTGPP